MRTKDTLFAFDDIAILLQYLYMDEENTIIVNNGLCDLQIRMTDDCDILCKNLNFGESDLTYNNHMTVNAMFAIICQLKTRSAIQFPGRFGSRFEEIKEITKSNLALNYMKGKRYG